MAAFIIYIMRWAVALTMLYSLFGLFLKRETLHGFNRVVLLVILMAEKTRNSIGLLKTVFGTAVMTTISPLTKNFLLKPRLFQLATSLF